MSGDLYDSNLLMYDRNTGSEWLQVIGTAVEGPLAGKRLRFYPVAYDRWDHWEATHPLGRVLSVHTKYQQRFGSYDVSPYAGYYSSRDLWYFVGRNDRRLDRKARVIGVDVRGDYKAYREEDVWRLGIIEDRIGDEDVAVIADRASSRIGVFARGDRHFSLKSCDVIDQDGATWYWFGDTLIRNKDKRQSYAEIATFWFAWAAIHPRTELYGGSSKAH